MPEIRDDHRRLLQVSARDADEHMRMRHAYLLGFHAGVIAALDAIVETKAPELPAYEEPSK